MSPVIRLSSSSRRPVVGGSVEVVVEAIVVVGTIVVVGAIVVVDDVVDGGGADEGLVDVVVVEVGASVTITTVEVDVSADDVPDPASLPPEQLAAATRRHDTTTLNRTARAYRRPGAGLVTSWAALLDSPTKPSRHFGNDMTTDAWQLVEEGFDIRRAGAYETLFTTGNGYMGLRGALAEGHQGCWKGTYIAGVYSKDDAANVDLVNAPDPNHLVVVVGGRRLDTDSCEVVTHRRVLDMRRGVLRRSTTFTHDGRRTTLEVERFTSMSRRWLHAIRIGITTIDHTATVSVEAGIDGSVTNIDRQAGTPRPPERRWDDWTRARHLRHRTSIGTDDSVEVVSETLSGNRTIAMASRLLGEPSTTPLLGADLASQRIGYESTPGATRWVTKLVAVATDREVSDPAAEAVSRSREASGVGWEELLAEHTAAWDRLWDTSDVAIEGDGDAARAVRLNLYHLLIAANPDDAGVSIGAKALTGEGYRGHVFWDTDVFMLPFFMYTQPEMARTLLAYRHTTLPGAIANARLGGHAGARFAWESTDDGSETTPMWTDDGKHRIWTGEKELHITANVARAFERYALATGDWALMEDAGCEVVFQAARFWVDRLEFDEPAGRYVCRDVIGPDEFHEGVDNNTFTNRMAQWTLDAAADLHDELAHRSPARHQELATGLDLAADEVARWREVAARVFVHAPDADSGVIEQFDGYHVLREVPITRFDENSMPVFPDGYDHFNSHDTTLVKQPDVVMLFFVFPDEHTPAIRRANYDFYEPRTMHKSSLSPGIHAVVGLRVGDTSKALAYFERSAYTDILDNQGNTHLGIHAASAGGTWLTTVCGFGGFRITGSRPAFDPWLPTEWTSLRYSIHWQGSLLRVAVDHDRIEIRSTGSRGVTVEVFGDEHVVQADAPVTVSMSAR